MDPRKDHDEHATSGLDPVATAVLAVGLARCACDMHSNRRAVILVQYLKVGVAGLAVECVADLGEVVVGLARVPASEAKRFPGVVR